MYLLSSIQRYEIRMHTMQKNKKVLRTKGGPIRMFINEQVAQYLFNCYSL